MLPDSNAATRVFCERPLTTLREHGIDGRLLVPSSDGLYQLLALRRGPVGLAIAAFYWYVLVVLGRLRQLAYAATCDVVFVQRSLLRHNSWPVLELALWALTRVTRGRIIYHCDDALYATRPRAFAARFRRCDVVLTGNRDIAAFASRYNRDVRIWEGSIAVARYPEVRHAQRNVTVIGWAGLFPQVFLEPVLPALREVCEQRPARLRVVANAPMASEPLDWVDEIQWRHEDEFSLFAAFDIGIMPLTDTVYNRAKEAYKVKEYMASGLPSVCSPVGHNLLVQKDGVTGFFADTHEEWVDRLLRLIDDPDLRAQMGDAGHRLVSERYDLPRQSERLAGIVWDAHRRVAR